MRSVFRIGLLLFVSGLARLSPASAGEWVYLAESLPSVSDWSIYGVSSYENGSSITSSVSAGNWVLTDNSTSSRCMERQQTLGDVSFNTGISMAARVKCTGATSTAHNLGITNGNVGGMYLSIKPGQIDLVQYDGLVRGTYVASGTDYHVYYLTAKNSTQGNNSTCVWRVDLSPVLVPLTV